MNKQPASRMCFICGRQNPVGLKMELYSDVEQGLVRAKVSVPDHFQGYPGVVHGGIVAAILDEAAGRAVLLDGGADDLMVTLKLDIRYRQPTPTETPLLVTGQIVQRSSTRASVHGEIRLADGTLTAEADALLVRPPDEFVASWEAEKPYWKVYD